MPPCATKSTYSSYESLASDGEVVESTRVLGLTTEVVAERVLVSGLATHGALLVS